MSSLCSRRKRKYEENERWRIHDVSVSSDERARRRRETSEYPNGIRSAGSTITCREISGASTARTLVPPSIYFSLVILLLFFDRTQLPSPLPPSSTPFHLFLSCPRRCYFSIQAGFSALPSTNQIYTSVSWWALLFPLALCSLPPSPNKAALTFSHNATTTPPRSCSWEWENSSGTNTLAVAVSPLLLVDWRPNPLPEVPA